MATIRDRYVLDIDTKGATSALSGLKGALIAVGGAVVTKQILDVTASFEDLRTSLNTVTGSAEAGGRALQQIRTFATQSQFGVEDLSKTFIQLRAAGIEPTERLLRTFTDTAAVTTDQLGSLEAITALLSRTTGGGLGLEELERLADRGIPVYRILQEEIGLTRQEISDFGQTAEGARKIVDALLIGLDRNFGGATQDRLQNLSTIMSNFEIAIKDVANEFGSGLAPAIKTITTDITNFLNANNGLARTIGQALGDALLKIRDLLKSVIEQMGLLNAGGLQDFAAKLTEGLASFVEGFAITIDSFVNTFREMQNAINNLISAMSRIPGIGFDVVVKPADQTVDQFIERTRARIQELKTNIGDIGVLDDIAATSAIISPFASQADRAAAAQFLNAKSELEKLETQLEQMTNGDGSVIFLDELATNTSRVADATAPMVASLRESAAAMREVAEAARFNEQYPVYEDAILRYARAQQAAAEAAQGYGLPEPTEQQAVANSYRELSDTIATLSQRYQEGLPAIEQNQARYSEVRTLIGQLNDQLQNNTQLTDDQRTAIQNSIATLTQEKNVLYERIKSGDYLYDLLNNTSEALRTNREQHTALVGAIQQLEQQQKSEVFNTAELAAQLVTLRAELVANNAEYNNLTGSVNNHNSALSGAVEYYRQLIESASSTVREQEYAAEAQRKLNEDLAAGRINVDQYAEAMQRVQQTLGITAERTQTYAEYVKALSDRVADSLREDEYKAQLLEELTARFGDAATATGEYARWLEILGEKTADAKDKHQELRDAIDDVITASERRVQQAEDDLTLSGLEGIQRELKSIELQELRTAEAARARLRAQFEQPDSGITTAELNAQLARIDANAQATIAARQRIAQSLQEQKDLEEEHQRTFAAGWKQAFDEYEKNATNAAQNAGRLFDKMTKGMEDSIVSFAKTGKFEFKDFLASIAEEILRSQVRRLIAQLFGGFGSGGSSGSNNFAGFFANGGTIPAGQFGIAGEEGPELISGPATVTPMSAGGGTVNYYINAVDAPSFQQLVARDPKFIHAVAEKGRSSVSGVRR